MNIPDKEDHMKKIGHNQILFDLVKNRKYAEFTEYLSKTPVEQIDINIPDSNNNHLVIFPVIHNNIDVLDVCMKYGAKLDIVDTDGYSITFYPIKYGYHDMLERLLYHDKHIIGISIANIRDASNRYPLIYAISHENTYAINALLKMRSNPNGRTNDMKNSLHHAVISGKIEIVSSILPHISDINAVDSSGWTALHHACSSSNYNIVSKLLSANASQDISDHGYEFTPIFYSVLQNDVEITKLLIDSDPNINHQDQYGDTILHQCVRWKHDEIFDHIMSKIPIANYNSTEHSRSKINTTLVNISGETICHIILYNIREYYYQFLESLIEKSNLNYQDNYGNTIMFLLVYYELWDRYMHILENKKINIFIKNNMGETVQDIIKAKDIARFRPIVINGYFRRLQKNPDIWEEQWQNECSAPKLSPKFEKKCIDHIKNELGRKRSIPVRKDKKRVVIDVDEHTTFSTFVGQPLDIIVSYKYITNKYPIAASLLDRITIEDIDAQNNENYSIIDKTIDLIEIQWNNQELVTPRGLTRMITSIYKSGKYRFLAIPIGILQSNGSHSNVVVIDMQKHEIERFEPHGSGFPLEYNYNPSLLDDVLARYFSNSYFNIDPSIKIRYVTPKEYIPKIGFQKMDNHELTDNRNIGDPDGFCNMWAVWYLEYRFRYPDIDRYKLIRKLLNRMVYDNHSFRTIIRNYSKKITDLRDSYLAGANTTINDYINGKLSAKDSAIVMSKILS